MPKEPVVCYELWIQPDSGPLTVEERGFNNEISWCREDLVVDTAKRKKRLYPALDFIVIKETGVRGPREVVYRTKDDPEFKPKPQFKAAPQPRGVSTEIVPAIEGPDSHVYTAPFTTHSEDLAREYSEFAARKSSEAGEVTWPERQDPMSEP